MASGLLKWHMHTHSHKVIAEARRYCNPRAIVVINPGNPTGQVLLRKNIEDVIKFAYKEKLFILADEVYQDIIYDENRKFYSFKKVLKEMGEPYNNMELASFMTVSKGWSAECGLRGGYTEIINMNPKVKQQHYKFGSASLCSTVLGQAVLDSVVNPPINGEPSYELFIKEKSSFLSSLKLKAKMIVDAFNSFDGYKCNNIQGAVYAFPSINFPPKAIEEAKKHKQAPDVFYAFHILEHTGICVVPGSGFGQEPGTYHIRTTILPTANKLKSMLQLFKKCHLDFMRKYK